MKRFVQYYDENYNELCGSDSVWVFDQRWSIDTIMDKVITKAEKQAAYYRANPDKAVPQHASYARIMMGEILSPHPITGFVNLEHN
jgi:hypothetical protein